MFAIGESRVRAEPGITDRRDGVSAAYCGYLKEANGRLVRFPMRHGSRYYQSFCDGHVEGMIPQEMFNPTNTAVRWNNDHEPHREAWPPL
jgi:prepilin-type processing-associated H-X9-DG protein